MIGLPGTFEDALDRLKKGEGDAVEITLSGGDPLEVILDPDVEDGLLLRAGGDGKLLSRIIPPLPSPPPGYPPEAPFVPQHQVTVSLGGPPGRLHVAWFVEGEIRPLMDQIVERSERQGWKATESAEALPEEMGVYEDELCKDGRVRTLLGLQTGPFSQVTLIEDAEGCGS